MRRFYAIATLAFIAAFMAAPAMADPHDKWHHGHGHWKNHYYKPSSKFNFVIYRSPPVYRYQYPYYPATQTIYYTSPPPIVQSRTIIINDPVSNVASGEYCREYQAATRIGGLPQPSYGTACLQPDGSWRITN